jgi:hypothetical protein
LNRPSPFILSLSLAAMLLIWSFSFIVDKIALRHIDALSLVALYVPLAALLMLSIYLSRRRRT